MTGLVAAPGATPIDPGEAHGLIPTHITTQAELNAWEHANILKGRRWGLRQKRIELLDESFLRKLHLRMFDSTWRWAGTFRQSDKRIGVPWQQISTRLPDMLANTRHQRDSGAFERDELVIRLHHQLVFIDPFPNGNGRHARLIADLLGNRLGCDDFTWGAGADLEQQGEARNQYLRALEAADNCDLTSLLAFARS